MREPATRVGPVPCGDLALTFSGGRPTRSRLGAGWELLARDDVGAADRGWAMWASAPTPGWAGYGLTREDRAAGFTLTLGCRPDHWLSFTWDRAAAANGSVGQWAVRTDRFATLQAYAAPGIVTTFSPATWGDGPDLDWLAVAGFVRLGWYPADRMPVDGVRLLRPATEERWSGDGSRLGARRWHAWAHHPEAGLTIEQAADGVGAALADVLDEQAAEGRIGLPVSGGLDSRMTLAALTRARGPVARDRLWAYSYGYDEASPEVRIARQVAAARGLPLHATVIPPYLFTDLDRVLAATEGLVDLTLCRQSAMARDLAEHTDAVIAAHWGDVWFGAPVPGAGPGIGAGDQLLAASTKRGHEWLSEHLVGPHLGPGAEAGLRDLLATEAAALDHLDDPVVRQVALKTEQWSLRWTEPTLRAFQAAVPPRLPFYDPRVADAVLGLPSEWLQGRRLQIEYLRRRAPDLARVEWQAVETDLFSLRHERTWRLPRRATRHLWRRLRPPTGPLRNWEVQLLAPEGRAGVDRWLLEPGAVVHDLVDRPAVEDLVARHREQPTDPGLGYAVSALLTFAVWKDRFT